MRNRGEVEVKIHYLNLDKSEPPADSAIIHNTNYFIYDSTTW